MTIDSWQEYSGVVHVHTDASGGLPLDEIIKAAKLSGVDFVILTDNGISMDEALEAQGWHDDILVLVGEEVCAIDGHFLAFQTQKEIGLSTSLEHSIQEVHKQAGYVCGIHYHFDHLTRPSNVPPSLEASNCDLMEVWSFHDEFVSRARGRMSLQFQSRPDRLLSGPPLSTLSKWDEQLATRRVSAVGSVNALNRKDPLLEWKEYFPFTTSFKTIRTHVLCPELPQEAGIATKIVWNALAQGHSFIANHALANPYGFRLRYETSDGSEFELGQSGPYDDRSKIHVTLPREGEVIIRHNGAPLFWGTGEVFSFPIPCPGVCRVEVKLDRRHWIISNPIRIEEFDINPSRPSTVIDFT